MTRYQFVLVKQTRGEKILLNKTSIKIKQKIPASVVVFDSSQLKIY